MKTYQGVSASPGLVLGQVSLLEHHVETFRDGPFHPERERELLDNAIHTAQKELDNMAERSAPTEQAIFLFQSMMLEDEGMMNEVHFQIKAGLSAAEAMDRVGRRYAEQLANMKDNAYMQLRSVDILDATRRVVNILTNRPRVWLALDHPVILAAELLMPSDLFSVPSGMILGIITAEGSGQSHAAIIARAMGIPGIVQVGMDFLHDCDGRAVILDATNGTCTPDPDALEASLCGLLSASQSLLAQGIAHHVAFWRRAPLAVSSTEDWTRAQRMLLSPPPAPDDISPAFARIAVFSPCAAIDASDPFARVTLVLPEGAQALVGDIPVAFFGARAPFLTL